MAALCLDYICSFPSPWMQFNSTPWPLSHRRPRHTLFLLIYFYQMYCSLASSVVYLLLLSGTSILFYPWANCPTHFFTDMIDLLLGVLLGWNLLILSDINLNICIFETLWLFKGDLQRKQIFFIFFLHIGQVLGYLNLFETRTD